MANIPTTNSLGLDFDAPEAEDLPSAVTESTEPQSAVQPHSAKSEAPQREKKKPYVNPDRVKTGGPQREKLTDEELAERMARMREQNEKIKQRRLDVAADEAAFRQTQEAERQKMERTKKIQDNVDKAREQNIKRKMDKVQSREWDSGKPTANDWKNHQKKTSATEDPPSSTSTLDVPQSTHTPSSSPATSREQTDSGNWVRGGRSPRGGRGRGRGRGRGGRGAHVGSYGGDDGRKEEDWFQEDGQPKVAADTIPPTSS